MESKDDLQSHLLRNTAAEESPPNRINHRRDAPPPRRRVRPLAAEALRPHEHRLGPRSISHDGDDFRRPRNPSWRCSDPTGFARRPLWAWAGCVGVVDGRGGSTVAEWGLVCGQKYKVGLVQSGFFLGCMIGSTGEVRIGD
ncbi:uncharacterized protein A4U43_C08F27590 [Asparagus officinalis]|nr:uncharacterized protein A4U43_C08F27590 [Asparagus officinalis]